MESFLGGVLIGISAALFMYFNGRVLGISGIVGPLFEETPKSDRVWRLSFLTSMILSGLLARFFLSDSVQTKVFGVWPDSIPKNEWLIIFVGGLLVGFGTRLGSGCTSGQGVCGISRGSMRSITSTIIFMVSAMVVVYLKKEFF